MTADPELETFILRFNQPIAAQIRAAQRPGMPGEVELTFDNQNAPEKALTS